MPSTSSPCHGVILATGIVLASLGQAIPASAGEDRPARIIGEGAKIQVRAAPSR